MSSIVLGLVTVGLPLLANRRARTAEPKVETTEWGDEVRLDAHREDVTFLVREVRDLAAELERERQRADACEARERGRA